MLASDSCHVPRAPLSRQTPGPVRGKQTGRKGDVSVMKIPPTKHNTHTYTLTPSVYSHVRNMFIAPAVKKGIGSGFCPKSIACISVCHAI